VSDQHINHFICSLFYSAFSIIVLIHGIICDCLTGTELKALHKHLSGGIEGNHKAIVSGWLVSWPIFTPGTSQVQVQSITG